MAKDLLLEIGVEEMPAPFMSPALAELKTLTEKTLTERRIDYRSVQTFGTPRRLVLHVKGVAETQLDAVLEFRGPKKEAAFDKEGRPSKAAQGFARGQGIDVAELQTREVSGVEYVFAVKQEKGGLTEELLPAILLKVIFDLPFPKFMRWAYYQSKFGRPVRWLLAYYGDNLVPLQIENVSTANFTMGHRFLSQGALATKGIDDYFACLRENYVIVDYQERRELIWQQVQAVAASVGGKAMENEDLLDEITFLVEYPTAFYGEFSPSYLQVPPEVLTTSMIANQRYFPIFDADNKLMPGFVGVRNGTDYSMKLVKAGNERVLKARLEDALFFWKEDTGKALEDLVPGLKNVLFHERLGSVRDKVERLRHLAGFMSRECRLSNPQKTDRAAYLCKADLLSNMVYEFPELQGIMGRYYALQGGEDPEVAEAVLEHYLPRFAGDRLPVSETGIVLSLAEKIYNLTAFFAIGIKPSGSQDPYALRRQALGIVNIIIDLGLKIDLRVLIKQAYEELVAVKPEKSLEETAGDLIDFILQRMRGVMLERGLSYDVIDAVLYQSGGDLNQVILRAEAVSDFKNSSNWENFLVVFNRSCNLSRKWNSDAIKAEVLVDPSEKLLYQKYQQLKPVIEKLMTGQQYYEAMKNLAEIRAEIDQFFEAVMVMVEEEDLKAARLGILKGIAGLCSSIADFSKVLP
jgi:glycyl-tRNA synthetase, tetrameric type, beta subunit